VLGPADDELAEHGRSASVRIIQHIVTALVAIIAVLFIATTA
jgi:hypothetical protein